MKRENNMMMMWNMKDRTSVRHLRERELAIMSETYR